MSGIPVVLPPCFYSFSPLPLLSFLSQYVKTQEVLGSLTDNKKVQYICNLFVQYFILEDHKEDADLFERGKTFCYYRADDPHDTLRQATVSRILQNVGDAGVTVELTAAEGNMPIGLTVTLTDETD